MEIIVGGLRKGSEAEILDVDISLAELPVVYDNAGSIEAALDEFFGMNVAVADNLEDMEINDEQVPESEEPYSLQSDS